MNTKNFITTTLFVALSLLIISCKSEVEKQWSETSSAERLFEFQERGWKSKQVMNFTSDIQYRATEVPIEYYLIKNQGTEDTKAFDSIVAAHATERIIEFEFEHIKGKDLLEREYNNLSYDDAVVYMSSKIQNDFMAVTSSNDTIACSGVLFERHFKVSPFKRVMLFFGGIDPNETIKIIYNDRMFNNGNFSFDFNEDQIEL
ncbi:MAG: hypothetical protein ABJM06_10015 [Gilvibacter sp.]